MEYVNELSNVYCSLRYISGRGTQSNVFDEQGSNNLLLTLIICVKLNQTILLGYIINTSVT